MVETIRLESGHTLTGIVGSNPTLSAITTRIIWCGNLAGLELYLAPALVRAASFSANMATRTSAFAGFAM